MVCKEKHEYIHPLTTLPFVLTSRTSSMEEEGRRRYSEGEYQAAANIFHEAAREIEEFLPGPEAHR